MISKQLQRAGDLKGALIQFAVRRFPELHKQALGVCEQDEENVLVIEDEYELINPTDRFVLETRLPNGRTIVEAFVAEHSDLSVQERAMVLSWQEVVEGIFQVDRRLSDGFTLLNLLNDLCYEVKPNVDIDHMPFAVGDFIGARIIPFDAQIHMFSGVIVDLPQEREEIVKLVQDILMRNPALGYQGNPEKLERGFEILAEHHRAFVSQFGDDEVIASGQEISELCNRFMQSFGEKGMDEEATPPPVNLPKALTKACDVGMLNDEVEGMIFLQEYGQFKQIFAGPDIEAEAKLSDAQEELVWGYLEADSVSTLPFRRMVARFPERTQTVLRAILRDLHFDLEKDFEDLMLEFKPEHEAARAYPSLTVLGERLLGLQDQSKSWPKGKKKIARNDPCPCGSGKKYKKCCG